MQKSLKDRLTEKIENQAIPEVSRKTENVMEEAFPAEQSLATIQIVPEFAITLNEAKDRIRMLQQFVSEMMIPNVDYGVIPGCPKPSLLKPGAEKLCDIFGFAKIIEISNRVEDYDKGFFAYEVKASLINKRTGIVEAEGVGNCNSREKKYRNQDAFCITNTLLKMAKKRAVVDAVLSATRSSGIFTQDMDEMGLQQAHPASSHIPEQPRKPENPSASKQQLAGIMTVVLDKKIPFELVKQLLLLRYNIKESKQLTSSQAEDFKRFLLQIKK